MSIMVSATVRGLVCLLLLSLAHNTASETVLKVRRDATLAGNRLEMPQVPHGFVHSIVGETGVLRIRGKTFNQNADKALQAVGIFATDLPAINESVSADDLARGCLSQSDANVAQTCAGEQHMPASKWGSGCSTTAEQANAESFRQALLAAAAREDEWTLILEDDVAPVGFTDGEEWNDSFRQLWESLPESKEDGRSGMLRLGWCPSPEADQEEDKWDSTQTEGSFQLLTRTKTFGKTYPCTTAYLLHKEVLPVMLQTFPCCSELQSCLSHNLFNWPYFCEDRSACWLTLNAKHVDYLGSTELTKDWSSVPQKGIFAHYQK